MPLALIALIIRIISNPIANTFQKFLTKKYSSIYINTLCYFLLAIFCVFQIFITPVDFETYQLNYWLYVSFAGLLCTLGSIFLIKALQYGEMSVLAPINSYKCVVGLVFGFLLLGERPTIQNLIGVLLIIFGSYFIFGTMKEKFTFHLLTRKDILFRFLALFCTGLEAVILKKIIILSSPIESFYWWCITGFIFSLLLMLIFKKKPKIMERKEIFQLVGIAIGLGLMQYSTNIVFKFIKVGLSLALFQLSGIIGIIIGYFIFKEKSIKTKILGAIIMIIGSWFILL